MPSLILREAKPADSTAIKALVEAAYSPWVSVIGCKPGPMLDDFASAIVQGFVQVLEGDEGIEAMLVLIPLPDALLLDNVAVLPSAQGRGHGRRLMQTAECAAQAKGYRTIRLYTHENMTANIGLYHRNGYTISRHVTERGLNRVYMEKPIAPETR